MNSIIKTSNDLTNLLERILTLNRFGAGVGICVRDCVRWKFTRDIRAIVCLFLAVRLLLNPIRFALSRDIVMQIMYNDGVRCECCALCAVCCVHGIITANKTLN